MCQISYDEIILQYEAMRVGRILKKKAVSLLVGLPRRYNSRRHKHNL
jgi:hypothetical protein